LAGVYNNACWAHAILGDLEAALADCNESLRLNPNDANALDTRGFTFLKSGALDEAIADYNAALLISPKLADSLYGRGLAKLRKGRRGGAAKPISAEKTGPHKYRG
jgi:tetratricopeptide (TPR) repeat protein